MQKPKILVTAAAGKTGAATAMQLLQRRYPVRALVHRMDNRSECLKNAGAEVMVGSLEDMVDLRSSLEGVQRAYFCSPLQSGTLRRATLFAEAAREAKLEVVVALSQWVADPTHPALHAREKWLSNRVFAQIPGVDVVMVEPGWFADNYMAALEPIAQFGLMAMPLGNGMNAPPSNEDIARVIVGALTNPGPHIGKSYRPTGPRLVAPDEIAAIMGKVLGRNVKYQNAPLKLFLKVAKSLGYSDFVIGQLYWFLQDYQANAFGVGAPTDAVLEVSGSQPEDFEQIAHRYIAAFPYSKQTVGSKLRASTNLIKAILTVAPDINKMGRRLEVPTLAHATLAMDSPAWLRSRQPYLRDPSTA
jgi:NAD(P)H dehydrogenase (quinone)